MYLKKVKIDYSKIGTGEAPFDGGRYLLFVKSEKGEIAIMEGFHSESLLFSDGVGFWRTPYRAISMDSVTHYALLPEFRESD